MLVLVFALIALEPVPGDPPPYPHASFRGSELGQGPCSYWLFEPAEPAPPQAPVVVLLHGWLATNPALYGAWIEHLTRRGHIVIFPRYYSDGATHPGDYLPNARTAILDALDVLQTAPGRVRPDWERLAFVGHSAGGNLAAQLAADPGPRLPHPRAVLALLPGEVRPLDTPDLAGIPARTVLVVTAADNDVIVGDLRARAIFAQSRSVPRENKLYVLFRSDRNTQEPILADHFAPSGFLPRLDTGEGPLRSFQIAHAEVNRLDRRGFWSLTDRVIAAAFAGRPLDEAIVGLAGDLGHLPDGRPVTPPLFSHDPAAITRVFPPNGARLFPVGLIAPD